MSPGGDRTPESGASFRDGGTENSPTGAGRRNASWESFALYGFVRHPMRNCITFSVVVGVLGGGDDSPTPGGCSGAQRHA